jgi:tetratricopeptide (TPR) repeat protein
MPRAIHGGDIVKRAIAYIFAVVVFATAALPVWADREAAEFFGKKGEKHIRAREWDKAEESFRKALKEDETYLPARLGLAESLLGAGHQAGGLEELRRFIQLAKKGKLNPAWKKLVSKAKKRLNEIDIVGKALQKIVNDYVKALVAIARRSIREDPAIAEKALRRALDLDEGNQSAQNLLKKMGKSLAEGMNLFNGKNFNGWAALQAPTWQCRDGIVIADTKDSAYAGRHESYFKGDFSVLLEARLEEQYPGDSLFAILAGYRENYSWYALGILNGRLFWEETTDVNTRRSIFDGTRKKLGKDFDPEKWNTFEFRFKGAEIQTFFNGKMVAKEARSKTHGEGFVGLWCQNARMAIRKVVVVKK